MAIVEAKKMSDMKEPPVFSDDAWKEYKNKKESITNRRIYPDQDVFETLLSAGVNTPESHEAFEVIKEL